MSKEEKFKLEIDSTQYETGYTPKYLKRIPYTKKDPKKICAFIPGIIKDLFVSEGKSVKEGDKLLILEAMKMENLIVSPTNGRVKKIYIKKGEKVVKDQSLLDLE